MNHESLSIPEDEVFCELEERQYQKFKARLEKELLGGSVAGGSVCFARDTKLDALLNPRPGEVR